MRGLGLSKGLSGSVHLHSPALTTTGFNSPLQVSWPTSSVFFTTSVDYGSEKISKALCEAAAGRRLPPEFWTTGLGVLQSYVCKGCTHCARSPAAGQALGPEDGPLGCRV